ncbi:ABC transporter ATP-binding protein [Enterovibrio coralii]|uniref:ABC transporter ATP-binding protein n=1 Tax=Enterovibrio coralii TaxID=294935 RepID=A0A135I4U1_9GAMM|nr:sn-glycerol-3-phosphate ABC transporter ATP-binding protein UgpC [Enterovibrio coralii]KXF80471.1 ABC transporter ATP-binding protein [Enterovibrio coralii]
MSYLQVKHLYKKYGDTLALKDIDFEIQKGEFVVFVGPSGCGKSTLLRTIAGLESSSGGDIELDGQSIIETHPSKRDVAMVFQSYALYPHMSVKDNMSFALKLAKKPQDEIEAKVAKVSKALKLDMLLDRKPKALSGGQRQRVAIGRAIVRNPKVFLFDEPLSNLDAALRVEMRIELSRLHQELQSTMIYVTHDQVEAMTLADKVVIMSQGEVAQIGSPLELYHQPANRFVATFIGTPKMNVLPVDKASANDSTLKVDFGTDASIELDASLYQASAESAKAIGFRPESLSFCDAADGDLKGDVEVVEQLGSETLTYVRTLSGETVVVRADPKYTPALRSTVGIKLDATRVYLFNAEDNALNVYGEVSHV